MFGCRIIYKRQTQRRRTKVASTPGNCHLLHPQLRTCCNYKYTSVRTQRVKCQAANPGDVCYSQLHLMRRKRTALLPPSTKGMPTASTPLFIAPTCSPSLPAFVPVSATSGPGGGVTFFPTSTFSVDSEDVLSRLLPSSSPIVYLKWPKYFLGHRVRVFESTTALREHNKPLMSFVISDLVTPISGLYADVTVPSNIAGIIFVSNALDDAFETFQLSWRRPIVESSCNSLAPSEFTFVGADRKIVLSEGVYSTGDESQLRVVTTLCRSSVDTSSWRWRVACVARRTSPEEAVVVAGDEGELLLNSILDALNHG